MKRLYVLYLLTLAVVVLDILLFHSGLAKAQVQQPAFRVFRITLTDRVGFDCVQGSDGPIHCFAASSMN